jgi:hypothetical protein
MQEKDLCDREGIGVMDFGARRQRKIGSIIAANAVKPYRRSL